MVVHETQGFILVRGVVHAKSYSNGAVALVLVSQLQGQLLLATM
jgi:hypothetical protein